MQPIQCRPGGGASIVSVMAMAIGIALVGSAPPEAAQAQARNGEPNAPHPPTPPAAAERVEQRRAMVAEQIASSRGGRKAVTDERTLAAMRITPRHVFMPEKVADRAYDDTPLPIGFGQTISQPYIVAYMTEQLDLERGEKVLEIGTGSGYQAAVLAQFTPHVYSIEIIEKLHERAKRVLDKQGYEHVHLKHADGYVGWDRRAPFDAIIVTCAAGHLPPALWKQLKPGGRIVIPLGGPWGVQRLVRVTKTEDGERRTKSLMAVRFVPMTGQAQAP
jgi:protein-L-isoaspartate(D-aspartate) O-methyltransferase